jgi:purine-cytosine permease-like protein
MDSSREAGGPGLASVIVGAVLGVLISLLLGLFVAAALNAYLAVEPIRGIGSLAVGIAVSGVLILKVRQATRGRVRYLRTHEGPRE